MAALYGGASTSMRPIVPRATGLFYPKAHAALALYACLFLKN